MFLFHDSPDNITIYTVYTMFSIVSSLNTRNMWKDCVGCIKILFYSFFNIGLEYLRILVSMRTPGPNFPRKTKGQLPTAFIKFHIQF